MMDGAAGQVLFGDAARGLGIGCREAIDIVLSPKSNSALNTWAYVPFV